jgi:hypothetical protein
LGELLTQDFDMLVHNLASLKVLVEEVDDCKLELGYVVQELGLSDLNSGLVTSLY